MLQRKSHKLSELEHLQYLNKCASQVSPAIKYHEVVNFARRMNDPNLHNCVMCGQHDVIIPSQNKDVCKNCDTSFWFNPNLGTVFKFCKGCKNFVGLSMFSDKPDASKCCKCRRRGRENYLTKKVGYAATTPKAISVSKTCSISSAGTEVPVYTHLPALSTSPSTRLSYTPSIEDPYSSSKYDESEGAVSTSQKLPQSAVKPAEVPMMAEFVPLVTPRIAAIDTSFPPCTEASRPMMACAEEGKGAWPAGNQNSTSDSSGASMLYSASATCYSSSSKRPYKKRSVSIDYTSAWDAPYHPPSPREELQYHPSSDHHSAVAAAAVAPALGRLPPKVPRMASSGSVAGIASMVSGSTSSTMTMTLPASSSASAAASSSSSSSSFPPVSAIPSWLPNGSLTSNASPDPSATFLNHGHPIHQSPDMTMVMMKSSLHNQLQQGKQKHEEDYLWDRTYYAPSPTAAATTASAAAAASLDSNDNKKNSSGSRDFSSSPAAADGEKQLLENVASPGWEAACARLLSVKSGIRLHNEANLFETSAGLVKSHGEDVVKLSLGVVSSGSTSDESHSTTSCSNSHRSDSSIDGGSDEDDDVIDDDGDETVEGVHFLEASKRSASASLLACRAISTIPASTAAATAGGSAVSMSGLYGITTTPMPSMATAGSMPTDLHDASRRVPTTAPTSCIASSSSLSSVLKQQRQQQQQQQQMPGAISRRGSGIFKQVSFDSIVTVVPAMAPNEEEKSFLTAQLPDRGPPVLTYPPASASASAPLAADVCTQESNAATDMGKHHHHRCHEEQEEQLQQVWQWDPSMNPLMNLAMLTERV